MAGIKMNCFLILFVLLIATEITGAIHDVIDRYFKSATTKSFEKQWRKHKISYENILNLALEEGYGNKAMNVYINRQPNPLALCEGYYHTDNQVHIILQNVGLEDLSHVYHLDFNIRLSSNMITLEGDVGKMIVRANYILFRNKSDIIYSSTDQKPVESSPFRFQQVNELGELAISVEGCRIFGSAIVTLSGSSVNLGHPRLELVECQYFIEIFGGIPDMPPVMAHYYPKENEGMNIDKLLLKPIRDELMPKMQAAMFTHFNTSALFNDDLPKFRKHQEDVFESTRTYINKLVNKMNHRTMEKNMGVIQMGDFILPCPPKFDHFFGLVTNVFSAYGVTVLGLDSMYASQAGGPLQMGDIRITEQFRFNTLQVIGKIEEIYTFTAEISDFAVDVVIDSKNKANFNVVGWRKVEFSCVGLEYLPVEAFVVSYLLHEMPKHVIAHMESVFDEHEEKPAYNDNSGSLQSGEDKQMLHGDYNAQYDEESSHASSYELDDNNDSSSELNSGIFEPKLLDKEELGHSEQQSNMDSGNFVESKQIDNKELDSSGEQSKINSDMLDDSIISDNIEFVNSGEQSKINSGKFFETKLFDKKVLGNSEEQSKVNSDKLVDSRVLDTTEFGNTGKQSTLAPTGKNNNSANVVIARQLENKKTISAKNLHKRSNLMTESVLPQIADQNKNLKIKNRLQKHPAKKHHSRSHKRSGKSKRSRKAHKKTTKTLKTIHTSDNEIK